MTEQTQPKHPAAPGPRFQDRVLGMRAVVAVALASLILGGVGGAVLGAASSGGGDRNLGPGGPGGPGGRGGFGGPGQFQQQLPPQGQLPGQPPQGLPGQGLPGGQLAPGTAPQDNARPDSSGDTTSNT